MCLPACLSVQLPACLPACKAACLPACCTSRGMLWWPRLQLLMDAPTRRQILAHLPKGVLWLALQAVVGGQTYLW